MSAPLLEARGLRKTFGHVEALRGADFVVHEGEIVGLVGDNGAGKSTLVKTLCGVQAPDSGQILVSGREVAFSDPGMARAAGIETVYQDLALADDLDSAANLYLGREIMKPGLAGRLGLLDTKAMRQEAERTFETLGVKVRSISSTVAGMSGGQRQGVAVARAMAWAKKLIILDEPTAALGVVQREAVLTMIERVRDRGLAVVLISHSMPDVMRVADRIEVLRLGRRVAQLKSSETSNEQLVAAMTGASSSTEAV